MALSLLQHIKQTQTNRLNATIEQLGISRADAVHVVDWTLALALAHVVHLNQRHGTSLVLALLNSKAVDGIWQTLDSAQWIQQLQQHLKADPVVLQAASQQVASTVLAEIFDLVDAASLGEAGLNELLEGQPEHLQGQAPDWVWQQSGLTALCGQVAPVADPTEALDLAAGIASLNKLVREAVSQSKHPVSIPITAQAMPPAHLNTAPDPDLAAHAHPVITAPTQRHAGGLTRVLEPLIALAILAMLYSFFSTSSRDIDATPTPAPITAPAPVETILLPTVLTDDSQLPPLTQPASSDEEATEQAIAEAQRTGAKALKFNDNEL